MSASRPVVVRLTLVPGSVPITGTIAVAPRPATAFVGWVALAGALSRAHEAAAPTAGEPA